MYSVILYSDQSNQYSWSNCQPQDEMDQLREIRQQWLSAIDAADPLPSASQAANRPEDDGLTTIDSSGYVCCTLTGCKLGRITYYMSRHQHMIAAQCYKHTRCSIVKPNDDRLPFGVETYFAKWLLAGAELPRSEATQHRGMLQSILPQVPSVRAGAAKSMAKAAAKAKAKVGSRAAAKSKRRAEKQPNLEPKPDDDADADA